MCPFSNSSIQLNAGRNGAKLSFLHNPKRAYFVRMSRFQFRPIQGGSKASLHRKFQKWLKNFRDAGMSTSLAEMSSNQSRSSSSTSEPVFPKTPYPLTEMEIMEENIAEYFDISLSETSSICLLIILYTCSIYIYVVLDKYVFISIYTSSRPEIARIALGKS